MPERFDSDINPQGGAGCFIIAAARQCGLPPPPPPPSFPN
ncbi:hypothetical protein BN132_1745 [Cronobacter turicensis 564]|nr:hypothetical protein BN132_1745 [Cronobacter turicensis 564]